jgi:hypothetical protein
MAGRSGLTYALAQFDAFEIWEDAIQQNEFWRIGLTQNPGSGGAVLCQGDGEPPASQIVTNQFSIDSGVIDYQRLHGWILDIADAETMSCSREKALGQRLASSYGAKGGLARTDKARRVHFKIRFEEQSSDLRSWKFAAASLFAQQNRASRALRPDQPSGSVVLGAKVPSERPA